eukprot:gene13744-29228_t
MMEDQKELLKKADQFLGQKLYAEAREIYQELKLRNPKSGPAYVGYVKSLVDCTTPAERAAEWRIVME